MAFNNFPYTDAHELNLDWVLEKTKESVTKSNAALEKANEVDTKLTEFEKTVEPIVETTVKEMAEDGTLSAILNNNLTVPGDIILIGDSYGTESGDGTNTITPWTNRIKSALESRNICNVYVAARNGSGFVNGYYLSNLNSVYTSIQYPKNVKLVLIAGGTNDVGTDIDNTLIGSAMDAFATRCRELFPNASMKYAFVGWRKSPPTGTSTKPYSAYVTAINYFRRQCGFRGIGYVKNSEYIFHQYNDTWYQSDGVHPTDTASIDIAVNLLQAILTGVCDVYREEYLTTAFSRQGAVPVDVQTAIRITTHNERTTIEPTANVGNPNIRTGYLVYTILPSSPGVATQFYCNMSCGSVIFPFDVHNPIFPVTVLISTDDTSQNFNIGGMGQYRDNKLWINGVQDDTKPSWTATQMRVYLPSVTFETLYG